VQRSPGSWSLRFDVPSENGRRKQKRVTFRGTKREAEKELSRLLHLVNSGGYLEPTKLTTADYLRDWLREHRRRVTARTWERYEEIIEKHLIPAFGSRLLQQLRAADVQQYLARAAESGRRDGKGGLSGTTLLQHFRVLGAALHHAVRLELVSRNVCDAVTPPKKSTPPEAILSTDEAASLLFVTRGTEMYLPVILALSTGARRGEVCALRWKDVDLRARQVTVCRSLEVTKAAGLQFKAPKTRNSVRVAPLLPFAVTALEMRRAEQDGQRRDLGLPPTTDEDLVVSEPDGQPFHPDLITQRWARLAEKIGRPEVRLHDLRHSTASFLLAMGVPISEVSRILGHATAAFTINTYGHLVPGAVARAGQALDACLGAALRSTFTEQARSA
jgi:integrase